MGGDFYDLVALPDESIGVAIGDIVGHDLAAAAAMGHLRGLLRAAAWGAAEDGRGDPAEIVDRVDRLGQALEGAPLATLMYGRLERLSGRAGWWRLWYANAGHPAPLLRDPDGSVRSVDEAQGLLLGVSVTGGRGSAKVDIAPGSTLVCFTDGLFERRADQLDLGYQLLADSLQSDAANLEALIARLLAACGSQPEDDTAILAIAFGPAS